MNWGWSPSALRGQTSNLERGTKWSSSPSPPPPALARGGAQCLTVMALIDTSVRSRPLSTDDLVCLAFGISKNSFMSQTKVKCLCSQASEYYYLQTCSKEPLAPSLSLLRTSATLRTSPTRPSHGATSFPILAASALLSSIFLASLLAPPIKFFCGAFEASWHHARWGHMLRRACSAYPVTVLHSVRSNLSAWSVNQVRRARRT